LNVRLISKLKLCCGITQLLEEENAAAKTLINGQFESINYVTDIEKSLEILRLKVNLKGIIECLASNSLGAL